MYSNYFMNLYFSHHARDDEDDENSGPSKSCDSNTGIFWAIAWHDRTAISLSWPMRRSSRSLMSCLLACLHLNCLAFGGGGGREKVKKKQKAKRCLPHT